MDIKNFGNVGNNLILNPNQVANLKGVVNHRFNSTGLEPVYVLKKEDLQRAIEVLDAALTAYKAK